MQKLPHEENAIAVIAAELAKEFDLAERILRFWLYCEQDKYIQRSRLEFSVISVAMALNTQACRQFRTAIELCQRGEAADANVISRCLFETLVATGWVLFPVVRLTPTPITDKSGKTKKHTDGSVKYQTTVPKGDNRRADYRLTRDFRARLLSSHGLLQDHWFAKSRGEKPGQKRVAKLIRKHVPQSAVDAVRADIGDKWFSILTQQPRTYSGLSLAQLVGVLRNRLDYWYETVYAFQSRDTHGVNFVQHVDFQHKTIARSWFSTPDRVAGAMKTAIDMFLGHLSVLHEHIAFGTGVDHAFEAFQREHLSL